MHTVETRDQNHNMWSLSLKQYQQILPLNFSLIKTKLQNLLMRSNNNKYFIRCILLFIFWNVNSHYFSQPSLLPLTCHQLCLPSIHICQTSGYLIFFPSSLSTPTTIFLLLHLFNVIIIIINTSTVCTHSTMLTRQRPLLKLCLTHTSLATSFTLSCSCQWQ